MVENSQLYDSEIPAEKPTKTKGLLKIFLGYAAGVGKSYAMLEAARQRLEEGVNILVGNFDEIHHYPETETLLKKLDFFSPNKILIEENTFSVMDMETILKQKPDLVLVDELAYTNPPNSRHPKRYQDVEEILAAGIDVYATLNIQHLESLNDIIHQITGVWITETIPNQFMELADDIEVIDLPPDELQNRIQSGKVNFHQNASPEFKQFFRKGNLTALRELALRYAADRVDLQMLDYMDKNSIPGPWPTRERILVAVSSHPLGTQLVRNAHRLATTLNAEWVVLYVETPDHLSFPVSISDRVAHTLKLAEALGAKIITISDTSIADTILAYAKKHNFTKIIIGKSPSVKWHKFFQRSILDQIIRNSGTIEVHIISSAENHETNTSKFLLVKRRDYRPYFYSVIIVALTTIASNAIHQWLDPTNLVMPYLTVVVICAYYFGRGPAMLASFLGVLAFDFFFTEPKFTLTVNDTQYLITFFGLLAVGLVISSLTARVRDQMSAIQKKQVQTNTLFSLSRDLTVAVGLESMLSTVLNHICQTIGCEAVIFLKKGETLEESAVSPNYRTDETNIKIAALAFENNRATGNGTDTYTSFNYRFQPLHTRQGVIGVLGVELVDISPYQQPEQLQLLEAFSSLAAMAIERNLLEEQAKENQVLRESEQLKSTLLNSVSHDFRTPLASITGALDSLYEDERNNGKTVFLDHMMKLDLIQTASEEAHRLNLLVQNLLDMTRLESGVVKPRLIETDLRDLISTALSHTQSYWGNRTLTVQIPDHIPGVALDFILMEQVLLNIFDNNIKYSDPGTPIDIKVFQEQEWVEINIADRGVGIPVDTLELVFVKFHRNEHRDHIAGIGLGLSICKGIVEAHQGMITAENRSGGGAIFRIRLPIYSPKDEVSYDQS